MPYIVACAALIVSSTSAQEGRPTAPSTDGLISQFESTARSRDAAGRSALFTRDAVVINAFGNRVDGAVAVSAFWKELYRSGTFDESTSNRVSLQQRELSPGLQLVDYVEVVTGQRGPNSGRELPPRRIHITLILRQEEGAWRITYYRAGDVRELPRQKEEH